MSRTYNEWFFNCLDNYDDLTDEERKEFDEHLQDLEDGDIDVVRSAKKSSIASVEVHGVQ